MREGQVPPQPLQGPGTRKEGQGERESERRERETEADSRRSCPSSEKRPWVSGGWSCLVAPGLAPPGGDTRVGWGATGPSWGWGVEEGAGGEGRSHKCGTGKTKSELGVSIGNSAFTFLLHFYFKHRKRERKQIEKKMCKKKREKKKIKLLSFLFWQHAPFSFLFLTPGSPTPKVASAPAPTSFPPREDVGETVTGRRETHGRTETERDMGRGGERYR